MSSTAVDGPEARLLVTIFRDAYMSLPHLDARACEYRSMARREDEA